MRPNVRLFRQLISHVGLVNTFAIMLQRILTGKPRDSVYRIAADDVNTPIWFRLYSTDSAVFNAIFRRAEYRRLEPTETVDLVLDCGANVGYSSLYFLTKYPNCRVIAVEPDPANFDLLTRNLADYQPRVRLVRAGVWSHPTRLRMSDEAFGDGREWARRVRECEDEEPAEFAATDIGSLLLQSGASRISILKIDVERAEVEIFARNYEHWLDRTDNIVIELHDSECRSVFHRAINGIPFRVQESGDLTICSREA